MDLRHKWCGVCNTIRVTFDSKLALDFIGYSCHISMLCQNQESRNAQRPNTEQKHGRRNGAKNGKIKDGKIRRTFKAGQKLERWAGGRTSLYKDYKSGGSVITERLYIDIKQDFF